MFEPGSFAGPARVKVQMHWGVRIPLRDGVYLNATLYLPRDQRQPAPAIFTLTPYVGQTYHDVGMYFAEHGYPFLTVDVRGRGNSEGEFRPLINEARDAVDVVVWLAQQSYCSGRVSMWGGSYAGYVQWAAASECPAHLAAIVPVASPFLGVDFPISSNIAKPYWIQWLTLVAGRALQDKMFWSNERYWGALFRQWFESGARFTELDQQLGNPSEVFQEWSSHPQQGAYWDRYNPTAAQYARISIPVLTITGSYDADQLGALAHYREHLVHRGEAGEVCHYLVIGPWDHAGTRAPAPKFCGIEVGPASLLDLRQLHLDWYAWTMSGGPRPGFLRNNVAYYVMGSERWRYAESLEAVTERHVPLYLTSELNPTDVFKSGLLSPVPSPTGAPDSYVYDPRDTSLAGLESTVDPEDRTDHRMIYAATGKHLVYHSAPFETDTEISGFFRLSAWLSIDQPDTDFRAAVYEIGLDGRAIQLTTDSIRARYRESLREQRLVNTAAPLCYDFQRFMFVARQVRKGHRLRLVVGPINSIYSQRNNNAGGEVAQETMADARPVTVRLFHDEAHPGRLFVPFGRTSDDG